MAEWIFLATDNVTNPEDVKIHLGRGPFFASARPLMERSGFYWNNFNLSNPTPWLYPHELLTLPLREFLVSSDQKTNKNIDWIPILADNFKRTFEKIKSDIKAGHLTKAVPHLSQKGCFQSPLPPSFRALELLNSLESSSLIFRYPFGWSLQNEAYIGLSPELLFQKKGALLYTMALAGTAPSDRAHELLQDPKELFEHAVVIEGIQKSLAPYAKKIDRSPTEVLSLGKICHLKTSLTAHLNSGGQQLNELVKALHPTPALGSYPQKKYSFPRTCPWLGAPLGFHDDKGQAQFIVTLRGIRVFEETLEVTTGCGVTAQSQLDRELVELELKRKSIKEAFKL